MMNNEIMAVFNYQNNSIEIKTVQINLINKI